MGPREAQRRQRGNAQRQAEGEDQPEPHGVNGTRKSNIGAPVQHEFIYIYIHMYNIMIILVYIIYIYIYIYAHVMQHVHMFLCCYMPPDLRTQPLSLRTGPCVWICVRLRPNDISLGLLAC